jgi:hypothetical protein
VPPRPSDRITHLPKSSDRKMRFRFAVRQLAATEADPGADAGARYGNVTGAGEPAIGPSRHVAIRQRSCW